MSQKIKMILADDHKIFLESLSNALEPQYEVIGMVRDGHTLIKAAAELDPDVIIVDISMPGLNGIEAAQQLNQLKIRAKIIFLTMHNDVMYASRALEAGGHGFLLKDSGLDEFFRAIKTVLAGKRFITPAIAEELARMPGTRRDPIRKITVRQREVLQLLSEGHSAKSVADILCISRRTVEFHKYRTMEELGVKSNAELIRFAVKLGIVAT